MHGHDARSPERQVLKEDFCPPNDITSCSFYLSKGVVFSAKEELKIFYGWTMYLGQIP